MIIAKILYKIHNIAKVEILKLSVIISKIINLEF